MPQEQRVPTRQCVSIAAIALQSSPVPSIRPMASRIAAADFSPEGSPVYYPRGVRPDDTPAMLRARQGQVAISRAHRLQARNDLQPSPSQTPPLRDIMRGQQELDAISRGHEEEFLAGESPSPTPGLRDLLAQQRGGVVPSSSAFDLQNASVLSPSVVSQSFQLRDSLGSEFNSSYESIPGSSLWLSSDQSTPPPVLLPEVPYVEGLTTLDDLAISSEDIARIEEWSMRADNVMAKTSSCAQLITTQMCTSGAN
ncbi:hypothetical protein E4U15_001704 [Claviceps sp. LM218 group G6]|nr:hypothetical protein E4U15_001704 [Claviceps sp. LM218 group G6]